MLRRSRSLSDLSESDTSLRSKKHRTTSTHTSTFETPLSPTSISPTSVSSNVPALSPTNSIRSSASSTNSSFRMNIETNYDYDQYETSQRQQQQQHQQNQHLGYSTPSSSDRTPTSSPFSLNFRSNNNNRNEDDTNLHYNKGRGRSHYNNNNNNNNTNNRHTKPTTSCHQTINHISTICLTLLSAFVVLIFLLFTYTRELSMAPNECIEFPENPYYTEIEIINVNNNNNFNNYNPPYRLLHVYSIGRPGELGRDKLTEDEIWNNGAPVLFVPGHAGSYNQTKASAAQAAVEAQSIHGGTKLNYFAIDTLEVPSGLAAELLWSQADFINQCVNTILDQYKERKIQHRESMVILAHSMGGMAVSKIKIATQ